MFDKIPIAIHRHLYNYENDCVTSVDNFSVCCHHFWEFSLSKAHNPQIGNDHSIKCMCLTHCGSQVVVMLTQRLYNIITWLIL